MEILDRWPTSIDGPTTLDESVDEGTIESPYGGYVATRPGDVRDPRVFDLAWTDLPMDQYGLMVDFLEALRWSAYPFEWEYPLAEFGRSGYADPAYGDSGFGAGGFGEGVIYVVRLVPKSFRKKIKYPNFVDVNLRLREA